jgi:YHS domain-containing protein
VKYSQIGENFSSIREKLFSSRIESKTTMQSGGERFLVILPLFLGIVLFASFMIRQPHFSGNLSKSSSSFTATDFDVNNGTCACNINTAIRGEDYCYDSSTPVMGGLDFVVFFTQYKKDDGTYDEDQVGQKGTSEFSSVYNGYTYYFISAENKEIFDGNPGKYIPQYGGFCSWGVGSEFCPRYGWDVTCLGPHGSYHHWTIQNEKLYFFWFSKARSNFLSNMEQTIVAGDNRWGAWFPDHSTQYMATNCYESVLESTIEVGPDAQKSKTKTSNKAPQVRRA